MTQFRDNPFSGALEVVATLRDRQIRARIAEMRTQDELNTALRQALRGGVDINSLSDASGLTIEQIRSLVASDALTTR